MFELGNIYYFIYLGICALTFTALLLILKRVSQKTQRIILLVWLFINFALHFLKQLAPSYIPKYHLHTSTLENICAVSTVVFPFIYLIKKESPLYDFAFFIGVIGGLAAMVYPTEAIDELPLSFEPIRFYFCHFTLFSVPMLSAILGLHKPNLKSWWIIPLFFVAYETIIFLNELIIFKLDLVSTKTWEVFFNRSERNNSFVFGPTPDMEGFGKILTLTLPPFMKKDILGILGGGELYWPAIWTIFPAYTYMAPLYVLMSLPFNIKKRKSK